VSEARGHWFLPDTPDVVGHLSAQVSLTIEGLDALAAWARGEEGAATALADAEQRGDVAKRKLLEELRAAFVTPLEPEDVFALSRGADRILNYAADLVKEAEALSAPLDEGIAEMTSLLAEAGARIGDAMSALGSDTDAASAAADQAIAAERRMEAAYYDGMPGLLEVTDMRGRVSLRELYRFCMRIGETIVEVAERVVYAVVKET
jgi:uncharacterized protein